MISLDELRKKLGVPEESPGTPFSVLRSGIEINERLSLEEYAWELCDAIKTYDFPLVTCFDFEAFLRKDGYSKFESKHKNIQSLEGFIRDQLISKKLNTLKGGLSNVLYWGYARRKGLQYSRVAKFRRNVSDNQLQGFRDTLEKRRDISLEDIRTIKLPQFGVSFASKILMFLSPSTYPVLDVQIARFALRRDFVQFAGLAMNAKNDAIPLSKKNVLPYETWAAWCSDVATMINDLPSSPCDGLRAVDVERAIYSRIGENKNEQADWLLMGPIISNRAQ